MLRISNFGLNFLFLFFQQSRSKGGILFGSHTADGIIIVEIEFALSVSFTYKTKYVGSISPQRRFGNIEYILCEHIRCVSFHFMNQFSGHITHALERNYLELNSKLTESNPELLTLFRRSRLLGRSSRL